jgi:hypothetical protein
MPFVRSFDVWPPCHLFIAIREEPAAREALADLELQFPFTVEIFDLPLMHLEDQQAAAELLRFVRERVPLTRNLPDADLLDFIAGYPEGPGRGPTFAASMRRGRAGRG